MLEIIILFRFNFLSVHETTMVQNRTKKSEFFRKLLFQISVGRFQLFQLLYNQNMRSDVIWRIWRAMVDGERWFMGCNGICGMMVYGELWYLTSAGV